MHNTSGLTQSEPRIRFWTAGKRGPRVLLIMGFGMRGDLWKPQIDDLAADHQLAWFDHRGVGESERGRDRVWRMEDMADDALRVLDELAWDRAHLVGVSMGGMVAQELILAAPERVQTLSLLATNPGGPLRHKLPTATGLRAFATALFGRRGRAEAMRTLLYPDDFVARVDPDTFQVRISQQFGRPAPMATTLAQLYAILRYDVRQRLDEVTHPTLVIKAGRDILVQPQASERLQRLIPGARLIEVSEAGHGLIFQCAAAVNRALRSHFAEYSATSCS